MRILRRNTLGTVKRVIIGTGAAAGLLLGGLLASASEADSPARARAQAQLAAGSVGDRGVVSARADGRRERKGSLSLPGLSIGSGEVKARTSVEGRDATARAVAVVRSVSLLDGLVEAWGVRRSITDSGNRRTADGKVDSLHIGGELVGDVSAARTFDLPGGEGRVIVNTDGTGLRVVLDKPARGYPAGTDLSVAIASADALDGKAPASTPSPGPTATPTAAPKAGKKKQARAKKLPRKAAPAVRKRLTGSGYAFPVFSPEAATADDWGGPRQIGPHEGNDIFAPFGSPVLAVADGTVHKVGTLPISGNRLWIYTDGGDRFFYAHLSSFAPAAVSGRRVKAGTVLGFVGNTGDAEPTPPHVHFEIHPGGGDAINPHDFLTAWQQRRDVAPGAWLRRVGADTAERPGTLVEVRDFIADE